MTDSISTAKISADDDDYNPDYASDISGVLVKYDIDWQGGTEEYEPEPDWDKMTGGIDDY